MQTQLSSTVLSKPEHVLSFIKHALCLEPSTRPPVESVLKKGLGLKDLRIVDENATKFNNSDDGDVTDYSGDGKDEMLVTSITLLLSVLEGTLYPIVNALCPWLFTHIL